LYVANCSFFTLLLISYVKNESGTLKSSCMCRLCFYVHVVSTHLRHFHEVCYTDFIKIEATWSECLCFSPVSNNNTVVSRSVLWERFSLNINQDSKIVYSNRSSENVQISIKNSFLQNTAILWGLHKERTILERYFRFGVTIERKHIHNFYRKSSLNVKNYKHGDGVNFWGDVRQI